MQLPGCVIIAFMRFFQRLITGMLALCLAATPLRADDLPELGDVASNDLSLSTEKRIGQQIMHEIRWRDPSYLDDPDVEAYLNQIGGRLTAASNDPGMGFYFSRSMIPVSTPSPCLAVISEFIPG